MNREEPISSASNIDVDTTRDRVIRAALTQFAQRGYEATSLDAIAAVLGVRKQTILYHFRSKEGLLDAVIVEATADLARSLGVALSGSEPRAGAVIVDAVFRLGAERPELLELAREVVRLGPPTSTNLFAALRPLLDQARVAVSERQVLAIAAMVVGLATEVEVLRAAGIEPDRAWLRRRRRSVLSEFEIRP